MTKKKGRILSVLLAAALTFTSMSTLALADEETQVISEEGLCEHHTEHTEDCGYDEAAGNPCQYVCELCGADEGEEQPANTGDTDTDTAGNNTSSSDEYKEGDKLSATLITEWSWADGDELQETDGVWGIGMPGANEDNPLTQDILLSMLPTQINATTADGENVVVDITWDLSSIPEEGIWSGDHMFTASLPEGYELEDGANALSVKVELGGAETYASDENLANHVVKDAVTPKGTTIDAFDYWVDGSQDAADNTGYQYEELNSGINAGHRLIFGDSLNNGRGIAASQGNAGDSSATYYNNGNWNGWTGNGGGPINGIVASLLGEDGFPDLNLDDSKWDRGVNSATNLSGRSRDESLAYLFDANNRDGKRAYTNVGNLLQIDSDGYYYYDSTKNFASLRDGMTEQQYQDGADGVNFVLYDTWAVKAGGSSPNGQFFPFNEGREVFVNQGTNGITQANMASNSENGEPNHYFGIHMQSRFVQQYGGHTNMDRDKDVTYEFSGDDDVWIYIDGVLVADLGGIHDAVKVEINFSTGAIEISSASTSNTKFRAYSSTLKAKYDAAGKENVKWNGNTFADNTYHTLDFFYLERGNVDSNMNLKYNLVSVPESEIIKVDQVGNPVAGAVFTLYATDDDYQVDGQAEKLATGTTNSSGEFTLVDDEGYIISLNQLSEQGHKNFVLRETVVPSGYRSAGDMHLYFPEDTKKAVLLSDNEWETGAYASAKVTATTGANVVLTDGKREINLMPDDSGGNGGLLFGVVLQYQGGGLENQENWRPVYGDPRSGWIVSDSSGIDAVINAAKENPYTFAIDSSGSFKTEIENLPGDMLTYYYMLTNPTADNVKYTVAYYYTSADTIEDAATNNTWRVESDDFDREFSARLYVPNIANRLYVQKVDDAGTPVNGAEFGLYSLDSVTDTGGTVTINDGETPYKTATTADITDPFDASGVGIFPEDGGLPEGTYYLKELSAPAGYKLNEKITKVIVDDTGVYADAGEVDDGIVVRRSVGALVESMIQFAADDDVDGTLHDITTELFTSATYSDNAEWTSTNKTSHLQYDTENAVLQYKPIAIDGTEQPLTLETDTGWSKLTIKQCMDHDDDLSSPKQDLGDTDLTNLFSGVVMVQVENERVGGLTVSKEVQAVEGQTAPTADEFTFTIAGMAVAGETYEAILYEENGTENNTQVSFGDNGQATVKLKDGERIYIKNLPIDSSFTVTETPVDNYETSVSNTGGAPYAKGNAGSATITNTGNAHIAFLNTYNPVADFAFLKTNSTGTALLGASFALYEMTCENPEHNHENELVQVEENGTVSEADANCWRMIGNSATSAQTGLVQFTAIPAPAAGETYRLVEYSAPEGYNTPNGQWILGYDTTDNAFEVSGSVGNPPAFKEITQTVDNVDIAYSVFNYRLGELPFSGNIGIKLFLIIGGTLMLLGGAGGAIWYKTHRRVRVRGIHRRHR